ncbi:low temperature requirement protein A [Micromonospora zamorensis]|uniref:low temperature requirement protein A n=1 Tax=Micromonospora zamorensis TaxID=709883 RepID=UPI00340BDEB8
MEQTTSTELFFDLVFIFTITQLSHYLIEHPDWLRHAGVGGDRRRHRGRPVPRTARRPAAVLTRPVALRRFSDNVTAGGPPGG